MFRVSTTFALLLAATGCGGTNTGPLDLSVRLTEEQPDPAARTDVSDASGTNFSLESATAVIRHIRIDLPDDVECEDIEDSLDDDDGEVEAVGACAEDTVEIAGPFEIDLMTGVSDPPLEAIELPLGMWKRVDVRFDDSETDALDGNTLVASGSASLESGATPFELALKFNEDVRFEAPEGVHFESGDAVLLGLNAAAWFQSLPLTDCVDDGDLEVVDGVLAIEDGDGSCSDIENAIKEAMKRSGDLDRED